ncbi:uncharacterized protein K460DRAFT_404716 [Cucurbitaria berberidis CBS 394.84]|uniref:Uncharacterized protein n=1 Tax=Cucurbitaria berberidis CBS 394.84 TaxID=1168544 RepID=A0A9P4LBX8_9PLEO|nr:uncharacterized protein K460DRAFT_404716 [Cucurbitaria berberidis CBS 394.84]KAF1849500.1 hypothetical protein K460DRAFT_404716 [Cucurbitaria berberidis CBS 394.84]
MFPPALRVASRICTSVLPSTLPLSQQQRTLYFCGPKSNDHNGSKPAPEHYIAGPHSYTEQTGASSSNAGYDTPTKEVSKSDGFTGSQDIAHLESIWKRGDVKVTEKTDVEGKPVQEAVVGDVEVVVPVLEEGVGVARTAGCVQGKDSGEDMTEGRNK